MLLLDLSHTSHTRARTGIQRVARSLHAALGSDATAICYDPYAARWRRLERWEQDGLAAGSVARRRSARWPLRARLAGRLHRWFATAAEPLPADAGLLVPEVFSAAVGRALPPLLRQLGGPRVAVFHDALALQFPELTPRKTVARFPAYLRELLMFDGVAAISEASRQALAGYWAWLGETSPPPIAVLPHGIEAPVSARGPVPAGPPVVLCVSSIEPRKNHAVLLDACEQLWREGLDFQLRLIGLAGPDAGPVLDQIRRLQTSGRPLRHDGPVDEPALQAAYAGCTFSVYPSRAEGFGLPVAESLAYGKPCVCSGRGPIGEIARDGGCLMLDELDAARIAAGLRRLLTDRAECSALSGAASRRVFRSWAEAAAALTAWMHTLPRR